MNAAELLERLAALGVRVWTDRDQLRYDAPAGVVDAGLREELVAHKSVLIGLLQRARGEGRAELPPVTVAADERRKLPSFAQRRLWFLNTLRPQSTEYNLVRAFRICGPLDRTALQRSLVEIIRRHEVLRSLFDDAAGQPRLRLDEVPQLELETLELGGLDPDERERRLQAEVRAEYAKPFDLRRGPLLRARLLRLGEDERVFLLALHHIVYDGWSLGVLFRELGALYVAYAAGHESPLLDLPVQYADYAEWQRNWLQGDMLERQLRYWRRQLDGVPLLELPTDRPRPQIQGYAGEIASARLPAPLADGLRNLARDESLSLFMVLLAGFAALLHRYTGQDDILLGSPVANRNRSELEGLIGFFVNMLALRTDLGGKPSFRELIARVRDVALDAYDHQDLPFEKLIEELDPERDTSRSPLLQVVFALQNAPLEPLQLERLRLELLPVRTQTTRFDLEAHLCESGRDIEVSLVFNCALFERATMERMLGHYRRLLESALADPSRPVAGLELLSPEERRRLLAEWNDTAVDYPRERSVADLFEEQVEHTPAAPAIAAADGETTYRELDADANRLAHHLRALGVGADVPVAILLPRSRPQVTALLAVLKAGGAYLPLDPAYPGARLNDMLEDSGTPMLITDRDLHALVADFPGHVICIDEPGWIPARELAPNRVTGPENLAYLIYTSGSTGRPKGVAVRHAGLTNLVCWHRRRYRLGPEDRTTQLAGAGFDASAWEIWTSLCCGACIHIVDDSTRASPGALWRWLAAQAISVAFVPTPLAESMLRRPLPPELRLRALLTGGDRLHGGLPADLPFELVNHYGPTENTVVSTCATVPAGAREAPPIGRPIDNVRLYVLDNERQPVPIGVPGELYIGGAGLARGYWRQEELTAQRFVDDPFAPAPGRRLFRSGDRVRYLADGLLEFLGRIDAQIKLRGFRIEPAEIEAAINSHADVAESVVCLCRDDGRDRLAAYVVPRLASESDNAMSRARVADWRELYDRTYVSETGRKAPEFDITGWNSSYTGEPLPAEDMREWVECTLERVRELNPRRVLEIGCGTGLLLLRLAPGCETYVGTDFSRPVIERLQRQVSAKSGFESVSLDCREADDFCGIEPGAFDLVIINSVCQYLPGLDYLQRVLAGAVGAVARGGRIFVGDLRSLPLLETFHASVQLERADESTSCEELRRRIRRQIERETELVLHPAYFDALRQVLPRVAAATVEVKRGQRNNELTRFRYDVLLTLDTPPAAPVVDDELDWRRDYLSLAELQARLKDPARQGLRIGSIPDARVAVELQVLKRLAGEDLAEASATSLRGDVAAATAAIEPEALWSLAAELGCRLRLGYARDAEPGCLEAVFFRAENKAAAAAVQPFSDRGLYALANNPLRARIGERLTSELRRHLRARLPEYMLPADFVLLDALPLTDNGKVDRTALPPPDPGRARDESFIAPRSEIERQVAQIWSHLLGLDRVGVRDNFFDLGGHSLLVPQVQAALEQATGREVSAVALFQFPTIESLAGHIGGDTPGEDLLREAHASGERRERSETSIAIIGMAGRFPDADNLDRFWDNLSRGIESIRRFSRAELLAAGVPESLADNPDYVPAAAVIDQADRFDAALFNYTPREAQEMDPQQRVFLECAWQALESAGYDSERYPGAIGVYAGSSPNRYGAALAPRSVGGDRDFVPTRVSYKLNLRGPSINLQTACSTSLLAVHSACRALLDFECDIALAGGVAIRYPRTRGYLYEPDSILSPDGHCRAFDAEARGTVPGEGAGVVVLKRLDEALADGDLIHAVIRGSAANNDGAAKVGFTAPGVDGQAQVIARAIARAEVEPQSISYVEAHGTATALGDPIEVAALNRVFGDTGLPPGSCALGSVKSNIGHLDAAAGIAGLIKTVLALQHAQIPPSLHYNRPNPEIDFAAGPFRIERELAEWERGETPLRAGVSSFGIGGTNVHLVVEQAPPRESSEPSRATHLLLMSAHSETALMSMAQRVHEHLAKSDGDNLADICFTLRHGRRQLSQRLAIPCRDMQTAIAALGDDDSRWRLQVHCTERRPVALLLRGRAFLGAGWLAELEAADPAFAASLGECEAVLAPAEQARLRQLRAGDAEFCGNGDEPVLAFCIELALARLWLGRGVRPEGIVAEGVGEFVAACLADVLDAPACLRLLAARTTAGEDGAGGAPQLDTTLAALQLSPPTIAWLSAGSGNWIEAEDVAMPAFWRGIKLSTTTSSPLRSRLETRLGQSVLIAPAPIASGEVIPAELGAAVVPVVTPAAKLRPAGEILVEAIANTWLQGGEIDWDVYDAGEKRQRVNLPGTVFQRERYWLEPTDTVQTRDDRRNEAVQNWLYAPGWQTSPAPASLVADTTRIEGHWLICVDSSGVGDALAALLVHRGADVTTVRSADGFVRLGPQAYSASPGYAENFDALFEALGPANEKPLMMIHLWALDTAGDGHWENDLDSCVCSLLQLAQAHARHRPNVAANLLAVTCGAHEVVAGERLRPLHTALQGLLPVMSQEIEGLSCVNVDIVCGGRDDWQASAARGLLAEAANDSGDALVALRGSQRWIRRFDPLPVNESTRAAAPLRDGGIYLLTGGLGRVGLALAAGLAQRPGVRLALLSRSAFPPREEWLVLLGKEDPHADTVRQLMALEQAGAELLLLQADVTDELSMSGALELIERRFGPPNGVIHAAGTTRGDSFRRADELERRDLLAQLRPKVDGLLVLERLLAPQDLDFCVTTSSLSAWIGGPRLGAYAAANACMDAYAARSRRGGLSWLSLDWDGWRFDGDSHSATGAVRFYLEPDEGWDIFRRALAVREQDRLLISTGRMQARWKAWARPVSEPIVDDGKRPKYDRPALAREYVAPADARQSQLSDIFGEVLCIAKVGLYDNLFELGGDSLTAMQIASRIRADLGVDVSAATVLDLGNVAGLLAHLDGVETVTGQSRDHRGEPRYEGEI